MSTVAALPTWRGTLPELRNWWRDRDADAERDGAAAAAQALADAEFYGVLDRPLSARTGAALPGLVSLPTTHKPLSAPPLPFRVNAAAQAAAGALGSFVPAAAKARLARLRRSIGAAARCMAVELVAPHEVRMVTLTYAGTNADWRPEHVRAFMTHVREWCRRRSIACRYVWVAELQKRGVIHYHVALWVPVGTPPMPKPDVRDAEGRCWWPHGMTRIELARHAVAYLMKYLSKGNELTGHSLPGGARSHGRGGLGQQWRDLLHWLSLPSFIKARAPVQDARRWVRVPANAWGQDGGWLAPWGGDLFRSEFAREIIAGKPHLRRVRDHGRPFPVDGPYSFINPAARAAALFSAVAA